MTASELAVWRHDLWLSQKAAAEALGISLRLYCYYEAGEKEIPRTVALACEALSRRDAGASKPDLGGAMGAPYKTLYCTPARLKK